MKIQKQVILLLLIVVGEFHCEEAVGNEGLELSKENEDIQEMIEKELNSPLLSEINDSELPANRFSVKEKRCPKFRLGSPLVSSSLASNNEDNKNHKLYGAFCKTCIIRNKCDSISECPLCEKWCTSTSKLCSETDADGDTKGKLNEDKQPEGEMVSLANRGSFNNDEEKIKDSVYTVTLNRGNLMEIILSLLGIYEANDVENMTISIKTKEGRAIVLNDEENSLKDEKLAEKLKDLCAFSKKFPVEEKNSSHEKLHELVQELLSKLRLYSDDDGSPTASANDDSTAVGSPNNIPVVGSRLKDAESTEKVLHQSLMNPDIIEDTPDMSQMRDQIIRTHSDLLGSLAEEQVQNQLDEHIPIQHKNVDGPFESRLASDNLENQQINGEFMTPSGNPSLRKNYKPLNSKDFINIKDQNVGTTFSRNKMFDDNDFEEEAEEIQKPLMGAASAARPLLAKIRNTNFDLKPQEVMDRLQSQHSQNYGLFNKQNAEPHFRGEHQNVGKVSDAFTLKKIIDQNNVGDSNIEEVQKIAMNGASAAKQFSRFNKDNEEKLGEPIHSLHHHSLHHIPIKHIPHNHVPHHHIPQHSTFVHHHRSSEPDDPFASDDSQQYDSNVRQIDKTGDNVLNSRFNSQQYDRPVGESIYSRDSPITSKFASQQYDSPVGQTFNMRKNELNNQYNSFGEPFNNRENQLSSRFTSEQVDSLGQPINRNNKLNSEFAAHQYYIPAGQTFNNRDSHSNHILPFQQFDNPHEQPINRNSQLNSRFVPQMYDRNANVPSDHFSPHNSGFSPEYGTFPLNNPEFSSRVGSSHKILPANADAVKMSSRESSDDDSLFVHKKEIAPFNRDDKIGTPSDNQLLVSSKDPQNYEGLSLGSDINIDNKHLDNHQRANEDKKNLEVSMPNADSEKHNLGISSDTYNSIENDLQMKQNHLGARASELMKKLKDRQDQTMQRLENQKQQLEKARENILDMVKTVDDVKMFDEDKKPSPSKTSEDSKLQSTLENIPKRSQNKADTYRKPQSELDKELNSNNLPRFLSRNNEDIVGSQPLENSFERIKPDNVPNSRSFSHPSPASIRQTLPEENPLEALNLDSSFNRDSLVGMHIPDVDSRGKFEDAQSDFNSLGKIIPAGKDADISFKNPSDIYFIGNGIKLPLQMVRKSDGAVHFSVDIDKLCSCNNTSCPKNHTAKELEQTVESILEKEAELKKELEDFGDVPLGKEKERNQRETVRKSNFINIKNRIANKFLSSIEDERNDFRIKRSFNENNNENIVESDELFEKENLSPPITRVIGKGFKDIKKAISNIPKNTQLITTRLLMPDDRSNIMQPTHNIFDSKTLEDKNENVIPISKTYKFKGLEDQLARKIENIEKTVDNYSKIDDQIFENESAVLNKFNENPIIQKEVGLASDVLGFFKKLAVDSTKHKNL